MTTDTWSLSTPTRSTSPVTFSVNGKQFVTLAAESDLIPFELFEPAQKKKR